MKTPRSRRWLAFFGVLAVLGLVALIIPIVYNLSIQLRPAQVAQARERWRREAPADYDLDVLVLTSHGGDEVQKDRYVVGVRGGRTVFVGSNDALLYADPSLAVLTGPALLALPPEDPSRYGVEGLFAQMEEAMRHDVHSGGRNYVTANFDPRDGHPIRYIHRVRGTGEREEWLVRLDRLGGH
jgi:hypothetical protein